MFARCEDVGDGRDPDRRPRSGRRRLSALVGVMCALAWGCALPEPPAPAGSFETSEAISVMANEFAELPLASDDGGPVTVGVLSFASPEGATVLGERMAHELSVALAQVYRRRDPAGGRVRVITRYHLDDLLAEQGMSLLDTFEASDVPRVGRLLDADYLVMGLMSPQPTAIHLSAQMLSVSDGIIVGGMRGQVRWEAGRARRLRPVRALDTRTARGYSNQPARTTNSNLSRLPKRRSVDRPWWDPLATHTSRDPSRGTSRDTPRTAPLTSSRPSSSDRAPVYQPVTSRPVASADTPPPRSGPVSTNLSTRVSTGTSTAFGAASPPMARPAGPLLDVRTSHDSVFMDVPDGLVSNITLLARVGDPTLGRDDISLVLDDQRRPTHVCIVMDTSGSMAERGRLTYAKRATREVLAILRPTDTVSIVTFNTRARAAVEPIYATKEAKANIRMVLETFIPDGNTDFDAALAEVAMCFRVASDRDAVNYAVFISDGAPTQGTRDPRTLGRLASGLARLGVSVDTIGVGEEIRLETLQAIAQAGNGRFHAVADDAALVDLVAGRVLSATGYLGENGVLIFRPAPGVDVVHAGDGWAARADGTLVATLGLLHRGESEARLLDLVPRSGSGDGLTLTLGSMTLDYLDRREQPRTESITVTLDVTDDSQTHERSADPVVLYAANRLRLGDSFRRAYDLAADGRTSEAAEVLDRAVSSVDVLLTGTGSMSADLEPLADLVERARSYGNMLARGRFTGELRDALYRDATEP